MRRVKLVLVSLLFVLLIVLGFGAHHADQTRALQGQQSYPLVSVKQVYDKHDLGDKLDLTKDMVTVKFKKDGRVQSRKVYTENLTQKSSHPTRVVIFDDGFSGQQYDFNKAILR